MHRPFVRRCFALAILIATPAWSADLLVTLTNKRAAALPDAVIVLEDPKGLTPLSPRPTAEIRQIWRQFDPFVTVVATGTAIEFPNYDYILHHVYSNSATKRFEIKQFKGPSPTPIVFDKPGVVTLGCNMHEWMVAHVLVADSPWFAKADDDGVAHVKQVPAGTYRAQAWYPGMRAPLAVGSVVIGQVETSQASFTLDVSPRPRPKAPPHDPMRY